MIAKWQWLVLQLARTLWVRAALFCILAIFTALIAIVLEPFIPTDLPGKIGADAVNHILDILASSMLAVTTFSLTVMVSAYGAATSGVTPRATKLLMQDSTAQNVLSTFLGSFLFSLVGIILLSTGAYGQRGRLVLFLVSLVVILLVVLTMLRWIEHLSRFGRVADTTERVEQATSQAFTLRLKNPYLGGRALPDSVTNVPASAEPIYAADVGYIQHIDMEQLSQFADDNNAQIFVSATTGSFVHPAFPLFWIQGAAIDETTKAIQSAFSIGAERSFDQDPRFGLCVLSEIASRALSPAVNDAGTAIDVVGRAVRLLSNWTLSDTDNSIVIKYPRVWVPPVSIDDLFDDIFTPIARDGAGNIGIQVRLQKAFFALSTIDVNRYGTASRRHSKLALKRADNALALDEEKEQVRRLAAQLAALPIESPL